MNPEVDVLVVGFGAAGAEAAARAVSENQPLIGHERLRKDMTA
jgi:succinate dehydrogenase/fumarate reductase flavoprotein subunit